jgi:magnesium transporter
MPVVAAFHYRHGRRVAAVSLDAPVKCADDHSEFVWVGLVEPEEHELKRLQEAFDLHPLAVEDASVSHQLPKLEVFDDQLFVVARTARLEGDRIAYGETSIFVGRHHIISVRHGSARTHSTLRAHIEASPLRLSMGVDYVLHGILDFIVDGYLPMVDAIEEAVLEMERRTLDATLSRAEIARIFRLRRELARFQRSLGPMIEVISKLVNLDLPCIDPETKPYFRDVLDHVRRVDTMIGGLREVLAQVFEVSALLEQQRVGQITRQLAAWAAILAVPTAIAGIYGMNFDNMPELHTRYGYFVVLAVIAGIVGALFVRFRRIGWL